MLAFLALFTGITVADPGNGNGPPAAQGQYDPPGKPDDRPPADPGPGNPPGKPPDRGNGNSGNSAGGQSNQSFKQASAAVLDYPVTPVVLFAALLVAGGLLLRLASGSRQAIARRSSSRYR